MGDLLLSLPAVHALRRSFPEAQLTLLIKKELLPLLEGHPDLNHLLAYDSREGQGWTAILRWGLRLRPHRFDIALVLNPTRLFHIAVFLAGIPQRIGYQRKWGHLLTHRIPDTKALRQRHESDYNLELMRLLGVRTQETAPELPISSSAHHQAQQLLSSYGILPTDRPIAIHPWTSHSVKSWPLESFLEVADRLKRSGSSVLLIGEPDPPTQPVLSEAGELRANAGVDLTGKIPLRLLPALLKRCSVLVSNDSGPAHVAAAVGTPTVVVAPKEHEATLQRWKPLGERVRVLLSPDPAAVEKSALSLQT